MMETEVDNIRRGYKHYMEDLKWTYPDGSPGPKPYVKKSTLEITGILLGRIDELNELNFPSFGR